MTDSAIKYVGVDSCKAGWLGVGLGDGDGWEVNVCKDFADLAARFGDACVILVDIPIGLYEDAAPRACDEEAREKLGRKRQNAVFPTPPRPFVDKVALTPEWDWTTARGKPYREVYAEAKEWHREKFRGKGLAAQVFGIAWKIGDMDEFMRTRDSNSPTIREVHPEICFWALNGGEPGSSMSTNKKNPSGLGERIDVLRRCAQDVDGIDVDAMFNQGLGKFTRTQVADDDILDALAIAITAKIVSRNPERLGTLPENPPTDSKGLPMEMVYAKPNNTESASGREK